jgi:hypothetical protein
MPRSEKLLAPLFGTPCWQIKYDSQLGLDLSFGTPYLEVREPRVVASELESVRTRFAQRQVFVKATCWLWVQIASWTVTLADGRTATPNTSAKRRGIAFANLEGEKVIGVAIEAETGRTTFSFDLGGSLEVRRFPAAEDDVLWTLYKPNGYCFSVRSDGYYAHSPGSRPDNQEKWHPLPESHR